MSIPTIQEAFVKLEKVEGQLDNIRLQQGRFESDIESEKRTRADRNKDIDKQISALHDLIYNRETGLAFELDRLKVKDAKRDEQKKQLIGLWVVVGGVVIKMVIDFLIHIK